MHKDRGFIAENRLNGTSCGHIAAELCTQFGTTLDFSVRNMRRWLGLGLGLSGTSALMSWHICFFKKNTLIILFICIVHLGETQMCVWSQRSRLSSALFFVLNERWRGRSPFGTAVYSEDNKYLIWPSLTADSKKQDYDAALALTGIGNSIMIQSNKHIENL